MDLPIIIPKELVIAGGFIFTALMLGFILWVEKHHFKEAKTAQKKVQGR